MNFIISVNFIKKPGQWTDALAICDDKHLQDGLRVSDCTSFTMCMKWTSTRGKQVVKVKV